MMSYDKTIFEIPSSFQIETVCFFSCTNDATIFILCALPQCYSAVPTYSCSVIYSYETATTDTGLTNQSYTDAWPISLQLVEFHSKDRSPPAKNGPATATRLIKHKRLAYICVEQAFLYSYIYNTNLFGL